MRVISLQSGSNGNSIYVETADARLLFDAGISGRAAQERLAQHGRDIADVDGVLISHDHADHSRSLGIFHRKFRLPIHITAKTLDAARSHNIGRIDAAHHFRVSEPLWFGRTKIETYATPHDAAEGVAFVIDDGSRRLGVLTDLGHIFSELQDLIASLDAVILESNYDPKMLANGPYPWHTQQRIKGPAGHLSNQEAATLLAQCADRRLQWACLGHLSGDNNTPKLAVTACRRATKDRFPVAIASRYEASDVLEVA